LREAAFRHQYISRTISQLGSALAPVAMAFGVLESTGSTAALGFVLAAFSVPQLVFMLAGGVWADRIPRQWLMMLADGVRCATQTTFGLLLLTHHTRLWELVVLQAITGLAAAFNFPASMGLTRDTVGPGQIQAANGLLALTRDLTFAVGPLVAGIVVVFTGAGWALVFDGVTFAASAAILAGLRLPARPPRTEKPNFIRELAAGWREVHTRTWVWLSIIYFMVFNLVFAAIDVLGPASVAGRARGALTWGAVAAGLSAGSLLGNTLSLRLRPRRLLAAGRWWQLLAVPLCIALGLAAPIPVLVVGAVMAGVAISYPDALWYTALQQHIPEQAMSRVMSFDAMGSFVLRPVSYTTAAAAVAVLGVERALITGGVVIAVFGLSTLLAPGVRSLTRTDVVKSDSESTLDGSGPLEDGQVATQSL
jgi:MFS family permease